MLPPLYVEELLACEEILPRLVLRDETSAVLEDDAAALDDDTAALDFVEVLRDFTVSCRVFYSEVIVF